MDLEVFKGVWHKTQGNNCYYMNVSHNYGTKLYMYMNVVQSLRIKLIIGLKDTN